MAVERFISHNRIFIPYFQHSANVGTLFNYSPDVIIKVYKIGYSQAVSKSQNSNVFQPKLYYVTGLSTFNAMIPSEIQSYESSSRADGNIIHGSGGMIVSSISATASIPAQSANLLRRSYIQGDESLVYAIQNQSFTQKFMAIEAYQLIYECANTDTQPLTLRQNEGLVIINDVYTQINGFLNNYFEFTTE